MREPPIATVDRSEAPAPAHAQRGVSKHNVGLVLAVLAGVTSIAEAIWPGSAPQSQTLNFWLPLAVISGCAFLFSAYLADRHTFVARMLLLVFGLALLASGIYFGWLSGGGARGTWALIADLLPAMCALAAAATVGRINRDAFP